jgi:hypothetical protein
MQINRSLLEFGFGMKTDLRLENPNVPFFRERVMCAKLSSSFAAKLRAVAPSAPGRPARFVESRDWSRGILSLAFDNILEGDG